MGRQQALYLQEVDLSSAIRSPKDELCSATMQRLLVIDGFFDL